jgi:3-keto-disaccharide hydrolase
MKAVVRIGVIGSALAIGFGLVIHLGTAAAQQPTAAGQAQAGGVSGQTAATPIPFRFTEPAPLDFDDHAGYVQIFDGVSLKGWDGDPSVWHVENGAIVGVHAKDKPVQNTYIVYRGMEAKDFDLKLEIKIEEGGGSGIQYRSKTGIPWQHPRPGLPAPNLRWMTTGPQADIWGPSRPQYSGQFYSENTPMGIIAWRGQVVEMVPGREKQLVGNIGDRGALGELVKNGDWNQYLIMARGGTLIQILNGQLMSVLVDDDANDSNNQSGSIGVEIEGWPSKISVRNVWLRKLR